MKKLINDPQDVVAEALQGIEAAHPDLRVDHQHKIIYRGDTPRPDKVGIISGGGSGHEPLHGGFVGLGMLDAACAGEVFTSPVPDQMLAATKLVDGGAGVLHVVKNYTGDVMNFDMAAELAAATGAQVLSVPAAGKPTFDLGENEMELGVGIHGEPGRQRVPLATAREIAEMLVEPVLADLPFTSGDNVIAFVNGLGGTPLIELYVMYNEVNRVLTAHGLQVARSLVGSYITSLEMAGTSVTLLKVGDELLSLWDAPVKTPALRWGA